MNNAYMTAEIITDRKKPIIAALLKSYFETPRYSRVIVKRFIPRIN